MNTFKLTFSIFYKKPFRLFLTSWSCIFAWISSPLEAAESKPNIIFILADDLGWADLRCFGNPYYETPNIDQIASQGMKFTNAHASPNCQPSRAQFMSGQYGARTGVYTVGSIARFGWESRPLKPVENFGLAAEKITIARMLQKNGYATGVIGKWHLGNKPGCIPSDRGFDDFFGFLGGSHPYFNGELLRNTEKVQEKDYLTDVFGREAVDYIRKHKDRPFFLYLSFNAVHGPFEAKPNWENHFTGKPAVGGWGDPTYAAMISSLDENVGRVLAVLKELELSDNTLLVFGSDNGGVGGYTREGIRFGEVTDNAPLRAGKGTLYEGGIRVPYIFCWPGKIAAQTVCDLPMDNVDLYPTFLEVAGALPPENYPLDGASILDLLTQGGKIEGRTVRPLFQHFPGYLGGDDNTWRTAPVGVIQDGDWKLMEFFEDGKLELYQLKDDIGEKNNLATSHADKAQELLTKLKAWRQSTDARMPTVNSSIDNSVKAKNKRPKESKKTLDEGE